MIDELVNNMPFVAVAILVMLGLYAMMFKKNLIKIVIGLTVIEAGVNLFLVSLGYVSGAYAPIYTSAPSTNMVLPTPQALTLTSIVIGVAVDALALALAVQIFRHYGSVDVDEVRRLRE